MGRFDSCLIRCSDVRVQKRPLLHPPIAPPYAGASTPKIVYVSAKSPFISVVKRVRKLLSQIDKRDSGRINLLDSNMSDRARVEAAGKGRSIEGEKVYIKATGKAIEKAIRLGLHFQDQEDCFIRIKTGSVGAIDDIVARKSGRAAGYEADAETAGEKEEDLDGLPETRVRFTSTIEIGVGLK
jgi:ribonuclease P/MRP protein subunit POP7